MEDAGLIEIILVKCALANSGQGPAFLSPEAPQGVPLWAAAEADSLVAGGLFVSVLSPLRARHRGQKEWPMA